MAKVDWLRREVEAAEAEVRRWPAWMRSDITDKEKSNTKVPAQEGKARSRPGAAMTPAKQAARLLVWEWQCGCCPDCEKKMCEHAVGYIAAAIEQARRQEREFYVKIIKRPAIWDMLHRHEIDAIRARAQEE